MYGSGTRRDWQPGGDSTMSMDTVWAKERRRWVAGWRSEAPAMRCWSLDGLQALSPLTWAR